MRIDYNLQKAIKFSFHFSIITLCLRGERKVNVSNKYQFGYRNFSNKLWKDGKNSRPMRRSIKNEI